MSVSLIRGANISLTKTVPDIERISVYLGWNAYPVDTTKFDLDEILNMDLNANNGTGFDVDASCFMLNSSGKVRIDEDFIFYNNVRSTCGSVERLSSSLQGSSSSDKELFSINLGLVPFDVAKLDFSVTIHEADIRKQNFCMVHNAFIRIVNQKDHNEIARFDLPDEDSTNTAVIFGEIYRHNNEWKFKAIGQGYDGGLAPLARNFGVDVED